MRGNARAKGVGSTMATACMWLFCVAVLVALPRIAGSAAHNPPAPERHQVWLQATGESVPCTAAYVPMPPVTAPFSMDEQFWWAQLAARESRCRHGLARGRWKPGRDVRYRLMSAVGEIQIDPVWMHEEGR